jgi:hypothetical protein
MLRDPFNPTSGKIGESCKVLWPCKPAGITTVLPRACIGKRVIGCVSQSKCIIGFALLEQSSIRCDDQATELNHHSAVEIRQENAVLHFTR